MQTLHAILEFRRARARLSGSLGFVPTMGYLHEGHLTLVRRARAENDHVAVSIFVNPTQFGPAEDLAAYPRDLDRDLALLRNEGVDLVFNPGAAEMYPPGDETVIDAGSVSNPLEGQRRPGHFRGVATVVAKLLNIVQPQRAYFGAKDAQQVRVIQRMVSDLDVHVEIVVVPTVREPDGLAMSSRNVYLTPVERHAARCLWRGLRLAQERYAQGERSADTLRAVARQAIASEPLAVIDYISLADSQTLVELEGPALHPVLLSLAVRFGKARLIDNLTLGE